MPDYLNDKRMANYAELIFKVGLGFKKGMKIAIQVEPENYYLAQFLAKYAYSLGAGFVCIDIEDLSLLSHRLRVQTERELKFYSDSADAHIAEIVSDCWGVLNIRCTESALDISDFEKFDSFTRTKKRYLYPLSKAKSDMSIPWCIVCMPAAKWASKFSGASDAEEKLWDKMCDYLYLNDDCTIEKWEKLSSELERRADVLNKMHLASLRLESSTVQLGMQLSNGANWVTGVKRLQDGTRFIPNIPCFEVYTSPDSTTVEGTAAISRPLCLPTGVVEGAEFSFKSGKLVGARCKSGQRAFDEFIALDKAAGRIGELGLVEDNSTLGSDVFFDTLWDENAGVHIALGSSHPDCFKDCENIDVKKIKGFNNSTVHADCTIGTSDMSVEGLTRDGVSVAIMKNGKFVI